MGMLSIGDLVLWCGGFGRHAARVVEVIGLEINLNPSVAPIITKNPDISTGPGPIENESGNGNG